MYLEPIGVREPVNVDHDGVLARARWEFGGMLTCQRTLCFCYPALVMRNASTENVVSWIIVGMRPRWQQWRTRSSYL